jgi:para-nitrobenzyl esterase
MTSCDVIFNRERKSHATLKSGRSMRISTKSSALLLGLLFCMYGRTLLAMAGPAATIDSGRISGTTADGVESYQGIPFAKPPVGDLRWRPPQPVTPWKGVRPATAMGHDCMQLPAPSEAAPAGTTTPAEDCLYLNVWKPVGHHANPLPVMVWIYGGGFLNGGASPAVYFGDAFARHGVVMVTFNYRLGRFGFFAHPALTAEQPSGPLGNYAYMDMIAALEWVHRNIAAFGGDATRVTIFGESAGGGSVLTLMNSPKARGLFAQAIVESGGGRGGGGGRPLRESDAVAGRPAAGETIGLAFAKSKNIEGSDAEALKRLRALSADDVVDGLNIITRRTSHSTASTFSGPMIDGQIVVERTQAAKDAADQMKIPLIIGANDNDLAYPQGNTVAELLAVFGPNSSKAKQLYDPDNTNSVHDIGLRVASDRGQVEPSRYAARTRTQQGQRVFLYRFSYVAESMRSQWPGATHASEVPFVFDTVQARYGAALTPTDEAMAKAINERWVAFVKTGQPDVAAGPAWNAFDLQHELIFNFTPHGLVAEPDPWQQRLDLTEETYSTDKTH